MSDDAVKDDAVNDDAVNDDAVKDGAVNDDAVSDAVNKGAGHDARARSVVGNVISNKMNKTITVLVRRRVKHPMYGKYMTRTTKLHAHDENDECNVGDVVSIVSCRPFSKTKAWKLSRVIEKAE